LYAYYQLEIGKTQKIRVCKNFAYGGPIGSIFRLSSFLTAKDRITKFDCKRLRMEHSFHIRSLKYTTLVYERYLGAIFNQAYFKLDAFVWSNTISVPICIKIFWELRLNQQNNENNEIFGFTQKNLLLRRLFMDFYHH